MPIRAFPAGTVHLAVVDPGVGTRRRPLILQKGRHFFVGPDNGIFSEVLSAPGKGAGYEITREEFFRKPVSATFHRPGSFRAGGGASVFGAAGAEIRTPGFGFRPRGVPSGRTGGRPADRPDFIGPILSATCLRTSGGMSMARSFRKEAGGSWGKAGGLKISPRPMARGSRGPPWRFSEVPDIWSWPSIRAEPRTT